MTLNEAIQHAFDVSKTSCSGCAKEHKQLAEWLIELKERRTNEQNSEKTKSHA